VKMLPFQMASLMRPVVVLMRLPPGMECPRILLQ